MEYRKPEIVSRANSLDAVQSATHKTITPADGVLGATKQVTSPAYEADE